jgi:predicted esterase
MQKTIRLILTSLGVLILLGAFYQLRQLDRLLTSSVMVEIKVPGDDTLVGTYFPGEKLHGVLLLEGFGSDQTALRPIASEFAKAGLHVLTFDFSGHGRSPGGLDYDNASTDRMAKQVLAAEAKFRELTGLSTDQIIFLGHSLGARVGLQASSMMETPPRVLILLGTQVNLAANQQAEFFTGVQDIDLEWVQSLGPKNPDTDIFLISGEWDDILTPGAARLLVEKLSDQTIPNDSRILTLQTEPVRTLILVPQLLHNYEIYSIIPQAGVIQAIENVDPVFNPNQYDQRVIYWYQGIAGMFLALIAGSGLVKKRETEFPDARINQVGQFFRGKLLLWVPALIPGALIASAVFFIPLGTPAFNLYYLGFFGGYGVLLWWQYRRGKMPGVEGKLSFKRQSPTKSENSDLAFLIFILVLLAVSLLARSGWWYTFPINHRFIWLVVFTPITALGFRIGFKEIELLRFGYPRKPWLIWLNGLIGLFPFFLYTGFLAALGSTSGVVGSVQGLLILALAILTGSLFEKVSGRPWLAALCQAFLLYWLILPQGVLFR